MSTTLVAKFLNLGPDNPHPGDDIRALLVSGPHGLGLCEAIGYDLPKVDGYTLHRDRSTESRANIAAYTRSDTLVINAQWHDLKETWTRTKHPGTHPPRSWFEVRLDGIQLLVGHQPPKGTDNTHDAQLEGIDLCTRRMAPWLRDDWPDKTPEEKADAKDCPRVALADWNRGPHESGPGPEMLCDRIDGWTAGGHIDLAVMRGNDAVLRDAYYVDDPQGQELGTDHPWGALVVKVKVTDRWLSG
jgi:hypothetical protein